MGLNALVLGGGGSRGAYQIGVWQALRELNYKIDIITGTSVGALNGAVIVQDDFDIALSMWSELENDMVLDIELPESAANDYTFYAKEFFKKGGVEYSGLKKILSDHIIEEKIRNSPIEFGIVTVEKSSLVPRRLFKENIAEGMLVDFLLASAACFPAFKPYEIDGVEYIDGAYYDNLPIDIAMEKGASNIIAVDLDVFGIRRFSKSALKAAENIIYIYSKWDLGNFLFFDKEYARRNIRIGYLDAMKAMSVYEGKAYTFEKDEFKWFYYKSLARINRLCTILGIDITNSGDDSVNILNDKIAGKVIEDTWEGKAEASEKLIAAAEICGRIFDISPLKVYKTAEYNNRLREEAERLLQEESVQSFVNNSREMTLSELITNIKLINKKTITLCIAKAIKNKYGKDKFCFPGLPAVLPREFIAAFYICLIEAI